jgi:hypothetical protein
MSMSQASAPQRAPHAKYQRLIERAKGVPAGKTLVVYPCDESSLRGTIEAAEIGIILPKVRIRDNIRLSENEYRIKIANSAVAIGEVLPGKLMAIDSGMTTGKIGGIETKDPAFQQPAVWIEQGMQDRAAMLGYTPVEPTAVLATAGQRFVSVRNDGEVRTLADLSGGAGWGSGSSRTIESARVAADHR